MRAQHGKDTPKLKGKCPSCGVNFSDHMGLVGTCADRMKTWQELNELKEQLLKFKPIACKDRMPKLRDYPILIWMDDSEPPRRGSCAQAFNPYSFEWWTPMLPNPE